MKNIVDYIFEGDVLHDVLIGDVTRFNGCFRDILTWLKKNGYGDVTMHKEKRASSAGIHRMHLEFKPDCKTDHDELLKTLEEKWGKTYDIYNLKVNKNDKELQNPTIWIEEKDYWSRW